MIQFLITAVIILLVPRTTKTFQARMTVDETYKSGYKNPSSDEFKMFVTSFTQRVEKFLRGKLLGFERVVVKKLANGSVAVDFDIVVLKSSNTTVDVIVQALKASNESVLGYTILGNVSVNEIDQPYTTSNPSSTATVAGINHI